MKELIEKYEEYIVLLGQELNDLATLAYVHGWRSSRAEEGERLRKEITALKQTAKEVQPSEGVKTAEETLNQLLWYTSKETFNRLLNAGNDADVDVWNDVLCAMKEYASQLPKVTDEDIEHEALILAKKYAKQSVGDFAVGFNWGAKYKSKNITIRYIHIDGKEFEIKTRFITGAKLKELACVPNNYSVWLKVYGMELDKEISDIEQIDLNQPYTDRYYTGSKYTTGS